MRSILFQGLLLIFIFFTSCNGNSANQDKSGSKTDKDTNTATVRNYDANLAKGKIIDSVLSRDNPGESYALYLPTNYTISKAFPCIYFFDAHARGSLPLKLYKDLAEKYGFVLIGSNNSKNNTAWAVTGKTVRALLDDSKGRINIDPKRIYTSGFSGGARVASAKAIIEGGIAGVIACSAGFPKMDQAIQHKCDFFGIVSENDFNLGEMDQLNAQLAQEDFTYQILVSGIAHDWPAAADFNTAMLWLQVNAIKEGLQPTDDSLIMLLRQDIDTRIKEARANKEWINEYSLLTRAISTFQGISNTADYQKQLAELNDNDEYRTAVTLKSSLNQQEVSKQQEYAREVANWDQKRRLQTADDLNRFIKSTKNPLEAHMYKRLLNFYGLMCYLNTNQALHTNDLSKAADFIAVFRKTDPKNPDAEYLEAVCNMRKNNVPQTIESLRKAVVMGYNNLADISTDPSFASLHGNPDFQQVLATIAEKLK